MRGQQCLRIFRHYKETATFQGGHGWEGEVDPFPEIPAGKVNCPLPRLYNSTHSSADLRRGARHGRGWTEPRAGCNKSH